MHKMWHHNCIESGPTATLHGEPCNWCDVTQEDIEQDARLWDSQIETLRANIGG